MEMNISQADDVAVGRLWRTLMPAYVTWLADETARKTAPQEIAETVMSVATSMCFGILDQTLNADITDRGAAIFSQYASSAYAQLLQNLELIHAEQKRLGIDKMSSAAEVITAMENSEVELSDATEKVGSLE